MDLVRAGRPGRVATWLIVPGYLALTLALTWPLAREFGRALPTLPGNSDPLVQCFLLEWDWRTLASRPLEVFDPPIFHPERRMLTTMDTMIGQAVLGAPVYALTRNPAAAYNTVLVLGLVFSAWAAYRLTRWLGVSRAGAFLCGVLFCFGSYTWSNLSALNLLHLEALPLGLWFAMRFARERRERDLWGAAATLAVQAYFDWYYFFHLATLYALVMVHGLVRGGLGWRHLVAPRVGLAALACLAAVAPIAYPYWRQHAALGFHRTLGQTSLWSADLLDYVRVNTFNRPLGHGGWLAGDLGYWPGIVTLGFAIVGLVAWRRRVPAAAPAGLCGLVGLSGFVLSLGPVLKVAGQRLPVPLPYAALFFLVPGFQGMRVSARFAVVALLGAVLLAGIGYEVTRRRLRGAWGPRALFAGAFAIALLDSLSVPVPLLRYPHATPPVYEWLARQPGRGALLELPMPVLEKDERILDAERQLYVMRHGKRRLDGVGAFAPPATLRLRRAMQDFPSAAAIAAAGEAGARHLIVHYGDFPAAEARRRREAAAASVGLREAAAFGDDVAYEVISGGR